jgi:outer membrane receptor for ferrienterochelin and colicins
VRLPTWLRRLLAGALLFPAVLAAQGSTGAIQGRVTDATTDSAVAGAVVLVSGTQRQASTNERGEYRIDGLAAGRYDLRVVAIGYASGVRPGRVVEAGGSLTLDVTLAPSVVELPGIVVTAGGAGERAGESVVSVSVISKAEIDHRNVVTINEALPFVAGVTVNNGEIDIRGASGVAGGVGSRVLMLLDGHPVLTADGGEVDFESLPLLDLDRAEVVKGAYSALYGSAALGGVVNLITTPVGERPASTVKLHGGVYDVPSPYSFTNDRLTFQGVDLQHSRQIGNVGARLAFARETSNGYRQNGELSHWLLRGKVGSRPGSAHPWDAYGIWTHEDTGEFFVWRSQQQPYEVPATTPSSIGDTEFSGKLLFGATLNPVATQNFLLRVSPHLSRNWVRNDFHDSKDWHNAWRAGSNVTGLLSAGRHTITTGVDLTRVWVSSTYFGHPRILDAAGFLQDELALAEQLKLSGGVRYDYHKATGGDRETTLSPKLGLAWKPGSSWTARVSVGRGYRAPSAIEQFVSTTKSGFRVVPNPALMGERAWSFEAGAAGGATGWLWLDGAVFQSEFHDLIGPAPVPNQLLTFQFRNVTRARVRGADLSAKAAVAHRLLQAEVNYLLLDTQDLDSVRVLPYRSRHNLTVSLDALGGLAGVDLRYRSRVERVLAYPADPRGDITTMDLRLAYRLLGTTVYAKVSNLFQAKYVDVMERTQGAPRSILVTAMRSF